MPLLPKITISGSTFNQKEEHMDLLSGPVSGIGDGVFVFG
jgi:hypothetical protein